MNEYLSGCQHMMPLCVLLPVCACEISPIWPGAQRCWPRAPAEVRGIGVEVWVTVPLRASRVEQNRASVELGELYNTYELFVSLSFPLCTYNI